MTRESTIALERPTATIARITFTNPPVNLIVSETVTRLDEILRELDDDPDIQVIVLTSGMPDFFVNHVDLAAAAAFPVPEGEDAVPMWTDIVLRLSKAPDITIASIRGRTRDGGNELALAFDLRYGSREEVRLVGGAAWASGRGRGRLDTAEGARMCEARWPRATRCSTCGSATWSRPSSASGCGRWSRAAGRRTGRGGGGA